MCMRFFNYPLGKKLATASGGDIRIGYVSPNDRTTLIKKYTPNKVTAIDKAIFYLVLIVNFAVATLGGVSQYVEMTNEDKRIISFTTNLSPLCLAFIVTIMKAQLAKLTEQITGKPMSIINLNLGQQIAINDDLNEVGNRRVLKNRISNTDRASFYTILASALIVAVLGEVKKYFLDDDSDSNSDAKLAMIINLICFGLPLLANAITIVLKASRDATIEKIYSNNISFDL